MRGDGADSGSIGWLCDRARGALGDVLGVVADALEIGGDLERRHGLAQIDRHGLAQRQHPHGLLVDLAAPARRSRVVGLDHLRRRARRRGCTSASDRRLQLASTSPPIWAIVRSAA